MFKYLYKRQYEDVSCNLDRLGIICKGNEWLLQRMSILKILDAHKGCVNSVIWDDAGEVLLSGSDDQHIAITCPWNGKTLRKLHTAHRANIFSAKFLPYTSNRHIVSCSGHGLVLFTDLDSPQETYNCKFTCHDGTCYDVMTLPGDSHTFMSCGEDGTVRWFDLRNKTRCMVKECTQDVLLNMGRAVTSMAINPMHSYQLAVATQNSKVNIFDRRMLGTKSFDSYFEESWRALLVTLRPDSLEGKNHRITSLKFSSTGKQVLASYSSDYLYLFDMKSFKEKLLKASCKEDLVDTSSPGPMLKRLRLRGDWSDTGPQALPESELRSQPGDVAQARPTLQSALMQRMTDVLSQMLNDPSTRAAIRRTAAESREESQNSQPAAEVAQSESVADICEPSSEQNDNVSTIEYHDLPQVDSQPSVENDFCCEPQHSEIVVNDERLQLCEENTEPSQTVEPVICRHNSEIVDSSPDTALESPIQVISSEEAASSSFNNSLHIESAECAYEMSQQALPSTDVILRTAMDDANIIDATEDAMDTDESQLDLLDISNNVGPISSGEEHGEFYSTVDSSISGLQDTISSMREGFVHTHNVEPSVNLTYSAQSAISGIISLEVGDEITRDTASDLTCDECREKTQSNDVESRKHREKSKYSRVWSGPDPESSDDEIAEGCSNMSVGSKYKDVYAQDSFIMASGEHFFPQCMVKQCYHGHRNGRTMIKEACFYGEDYIMSGSDCGRVFAWHKDTGRLVMLWDADGHVVNCVQPHPYLPVLATSGIDYDIKVWAPLSEELRFDEDHAAEIIRRNEALLEETKDTITVPAAFMIRMLASLNHIRRGNRSRNRTDQQGEEEL